LGRGQFLNVGFEFAEVVVGFWNYLVPRILNFGAPFL
jgi:hypothetical protein